MSHTDNTIPGEPTTETIRLTPLQRQRIATGGCVGTFSRVGDEWVCDCDACVRDRADAWTAHREANEAMGRGGDTNWMND